MSLNCSLALSTKNIHQSQAAALLLDRRSSSSKILHPHFRDPPARTQARALACKPSTGAGRPADPASDGAKVDEKPTLVMETLLGGPTTAAPRRPPRSCTTVMPHLIGRIVVPPAKVC